MLYRKENSNNNASLPQKGFYHLLQYHIGIAYRVNDQNAKTFLTESSDFFEWDTEIEDLSSLGNWVAVRTKIYH